VLYKTISAAVCGIDANLSEVEVDASPSSLTARISSRWTFPTLACARAASASVPRSRTEATTFRRPTPPSLWRLPTIAKRVQASTCPWRWEFSVPRAACAIAHTAHRKKARFVGELSLGGGLRGVRVAVPIAITTHSNKITKVVLPEVNAREAAAVERSFGRSGPARPCWPSVWPPSCRHLTCADALETTKIHSVAGVLDASGVVGPLPFRSPHHITSMRDLSALA
jgi:hypothetical protein